MNQKGAYPIAITGIYAALAIILGYVETLLPIQIGIPGVKPGFANIVTVFVLYMLGAKYAFFVNLIRIIVINSMFGTMMTLLFSVSGGMLSLLVMAFMKKLPGIHTVGVSVCGGVAHNIGQIIIAVIFVKNSIILLYLPILGIGGILAGIFIGIVAGLLLKKLQQNRMEHNDSIFKGNN